ncbi:MAG: LCP family protein [Clostridia bacterium]|nr:LCP family protein [Clostridia bacterium]
MRKILSLLLAMITAFSFVGAFSETTAPSRGGVTIYDIPIDEDDFSTASVNGEALEEGQAQVQEGVSEETFEEILEQENEDDLIVYDPVEEYLYDPDEITEALDMLDGMRNILLLGVDSRTGKIEGRTDTMILLTVDIEGKVIKLTSFLRDLYVEIPGRKNNRMNSAYVFGGFELLQKTFEKNFGVKPDAYVAVNLSGLAQIIDALGGVYVDVDPKKIDRVNAVIYWYNKQVLNLTNLKHGYLTKGGYQKLTGKQAESWARYRYSESDYQRSARQRQLISIIFEEVKNMSVKDLVSFALANANLIETNLSIQEIISLAPAVLAMKDAEIQEFRIPIDGGASSQTISGMSVLVPDRKKNVNALKEFLLGD